MPGSASATRRRALGKAEPLARALRSRDGAVLPEPRRSPPGRRRSGLERPSPSGAVAGWSSRLPGGRVRATRGAGCSSAGLSSGTRILLLAATPREHAPEGPGTARPAARRAHRNRFVDGVSAPADVAAGSPSGRVPSRTAWRLVPKGGTRPAAGVRPAPAVLPAPAALRSSVPRPLPAPVVPCALREPAPVPDTDSPGARGATGASVARGMRETTISPAAGVDRERGGREPGPEPARPPGPRRRARQIGRALAGELPLVVGLPQGLQDVGHAAIPSPSRPSPRGPAGVASATSAPSRGARGSPPVITSRTSVSSPTTPSATSACRRWKAATLALSASSYTSGAPSSRGARLAQLVQTLAEPGDVATPRAGPEGRAGEGRRLPEHDERRRSSDRPARRGVR